MYLRTGTRSHVTAPRFIPSKEPFPGWDVPCIVVHRPQCTNTKGQIINVYTQEDEKVQKNLQNLKPSLFDQSCITRLSTYLHYLQISLTTPMFCIISYPAQLRVPVKHTLIMRIMWSSYWCKSPFIFFSTAHQTVPHFTAKTCTNYIQLSSNVNSISTDGLRRKRCATVHTTLSSVACLSYIKQNVHIGCAQD